MSAQTAAEAKAQVVRTECTLDDIDMGTRAVAQFPASQDRFLTTFTGIEPGSYVQLSLPVSSAKRERLIKGALITVRYLHRGQVRGFQSEVLATTLHPFGLLFLEYPQHLEILEKRRHPRMNCFLPVTIYRKEQASMAVILNLSESGCRLFLDPRNNDSNGFAIGDRISIKTRLYECYGEMQLDGVVKNMPMTNHNPNLGVRFKYQTRENAQAVKGHLDSMRELLEVSC